MGIYDRDYMRAAPTAGRARRPSSTTVRAPLGRERVDEVAFTALVVLLVGQLLTLAIPAVTSGAGGREYAWMAEYGLAGFDWSSRGVLLLLPGASAAALLLRLVLGQGRWLGVGVALVGSITLATLHEAAGGWDALEGALRSTMTASGEGAVWLVAAAAGCVVAACIAAASSGRRASGARLLAALAIPPALAYAVAPLWNPLDVEPWTAQLARVWATPVVESQDEVAVLLSGRRSSVGAFVPIRISWVQWTSKAAVSLAVAATALAMIGIACAALRALLDREKVASLAGFGLLVPALGGVALVANFFWIWSHPHGSLGDGLLASVDLLGRALSGITVCALPFVGVGLGLSSSRRSRQRSRSARRWVSSLPRAAIVGGLGLCLFASIETHGDVAAAWRALEALLVEARDGPSGPR